MVTISRIELEISEIISEIAIDSDFMVGRLDGKNVREHLLATLSTIPRNHVVVIAFNGVELMDASFSDEVFATLAAARGRSELAVAPYVLRSLNPVSLDNLEQALISRSAREAGLRNCLVVVADDESEKFRLLGKSEDHVKQTFDLLTKCGELTTKVVADKFSLGTTAASTRLKVLFDLGLAVRNEVRDEQGKQFIYFNLL